MFSFSPTSWQSVFKYWSLCKAVARTTCYFSSDWISSGSDIWMTSNHHLPTNLYIPTSIFRHEGVTWKYPTFTEHCSEFYNRLEPGSPDMVSHFYLWAIVHPNFFCLLDLFTCVPHSILRMDQFTGSFFKLYNYLCGLAQIEYCPTSP